MRNTYDIPKEERQAERKELNPEVDRAPAQVGVIDESKLRIPLNNIKGADPIDLHYNDPIDWYDQASITAPNRWRKAIFAYYLGPLSTQQQITNKEAFLDREKSWLAANMDHYLKMGPNGRLRGWAELALFFNLKFWEKVFPEDPVPRPYRSTAQIRGLKVDIDVQVARGLAFTDHTMHRRHVEAGSVGGTRVLGVNRVRKAGAKNKKDKRGKRNGGYSWKRLQALAKPNSSKSDTS